MQIEEVQDLLSTAMQSDLERGVAWMNDEAWALFEMDFPALSYAIGKILDLEISDE